MIDVCLKVGNVLDNDAAVRAFVGDDIFPIAIPLEGEDQVIPLPHITFKRSVVPGDDLSGDQSANVTIICESKDYKEGVQIAQAVADAMENADMFNPSVEEDYIFPAYRQILTFRVL